MSGALCFAGTRVPVQTLFDYLEGKSSLEDFLDDFPTVSREVAVAVLEDAREHLFADARGLGYRHARRGRVGYTWKPGIGMSEVGGCALHANGHNRVLVSDRFAAAIL